MMTRQFQVVSVAVLAVGLALPAAALAQGRVQGTVVDATGSAVPGVLILVERGLLKRETVSDRQGRFTVEPLAPGTVQVSASLSGFTTYREAIEIGSAEDRQLVIRLETAPIAESVTVVAEGRTYKPGSATTGTKLDLSLLDTPQSVTVITSKLIEDRQVVRLAELADNVAGVRASPGYGGLSSGNYYMRGFRGSFSGGNLRDGFRDYTFLSARDVQAIERTEFLKGPASIVYGQQEVGGIVNTILKKPQPVRFGRVGLVAGGFGLVRPTIDLNTPVNRSGTVLFRLNAAYEDGDSHRDFVRNKSVYVAPAVTWTIRPGTTLRVNAEVQRYAYLFDLGYAPEPEFFEQSIDKYYGEPDFNYTRTRQVGGTVELTHAFNERWTLRSAVNGLAAEAEPRLLNPGALQADRRTINRTVLQSDERSRNYSLQTELYGRVATGPLQHNLVVGTDLVRWDFRYVFFSGVGGARPIDRIDPVYGAFPTEFTPLFGDRTYANIAGTYVQDQIALRHNVKLLTGARIDFVDQRSDDPLTGLRVNSRSSTNVAPRAGLLVNPWPSTSLYASYTNSFLPQYGVSRTGERFEPQHGRQYEVGMKQDLVGNRLFATLALYRLWKTNVPTPDPEDTRFSITTGEQRSKGIELELTGRLARQVSIIASYSAMAALVSRDNRLPVGNWLVGVPKHSGSVWTTYDIDQGVLSGVSLGGGIYAASARQARLPNVATLIPSYGRVDLYVAYRTTHWSAQVNVKNVNNVKWYEAQGANVIPQASRHALVSLGYQF